MTSTAYDIVSGIPDSMLDGDRLVGALIGCGRRAICWALFVLSTRSTWAAAAILWRAASP